MTSETQAEMAELRARVSELKLEVKSSLSTALEVPEGLASGADEYQITGRLVFYRKGDSKGGSYSAAQLYATDVSIPVTWNEIFGILGPSLMNEATESELRKSVFRFCENVVKDEPAGYMPRNFGKFWSLKVEEELFQDVLVQLFALNLMTHGLKKRSATDQNKYWALTPLGQDTLMKLRAIQKQPALVGT
ncbi:hypothetical protein J2S90_003043 [Arthrobacter bambusae]|uniref:Uncharacterized protein n=2 Tax=Arthrobacter bambusae TaxID=1338426 RepID=A0AAW8DIW6_9MICC|nr:hypothetical protein [Arthrobacter bambusae]MDQ0181875.1 hypothetical protein [Arthrobacter bambusae]